MTLDPKASGAWRYSINYGPDGEEDWANLITPDGEHVANIRTRHALTIVSALAALPSTAGEPVAWRWPNTGGEFNIWWGSEPPPFAERLAIYPSALYTHPALPPPPVAPQGRGEADRNAVVEAIEKAAQLAETFDGPGHIFAPGDDGSLPKGWAGCRRTIADAIRALKEDHQCLRA